VADWPLPPYVEPRGPAGDDQSVVRAFIRSEPAPFSDRFHVEGPVLIAGRDVPAALRLGPGSALVRADLPEDLLPAKALVEQVLSEEGMELLDAETLFAAPVAVQMAGLRMSSWDLWGSDIDQAFAALRQAAQGGGDDFLTGAPPPIPPAE
jgi:hypothetical protein